MNGIIHHRSVGLTLGDCSKPLPKKMVPFLTTTSRAGELLLFQSLADTLYSQFFKL